MRGKDNTGASLGAKYSPAVKDDVKTLPDKWNDMTMASRSRPPGGSQEAGPPSAGLSRGVKMMLLVFLCLQNVIYTMLRRYRGGILARSWGRSEAGSTEGPYPPCARQYFDGIRFPSVHTRAVLCCAVWCRGHTKSTLKRFLS